MPQDSTDATGFLGFLRIPQIPLDPLGCAGSHKILRVPCDPSKCFPGLHRVPQGFPRAASTMATGWGGGRGYDFPSSLRYFYFEPGNHSHSPPPPSRSHCSRSPGSPWFPMRTPGFSRLPCIGPVIPTFPRIPPLRFPNVPHGSAIPPQDPAGFPQIPQDSTGFHGSRRSSGICPPPGVVMVKGKRRCMLEGRGRDAEGCDRHPASQPSTQIPSLHPNASPPVGMTVPCMGTGRGKCVCACVGYPLTCSLHTSLLPTAPQTAGPGRGFLFGHWVLGIPELSSEFLS